MINIKAKDEKILVRDFFQTMQNQLNRAESLVNDLQICKNIIELDCFKSAEGIVVFCADEKEPLLDAVVEKAFAEGKKVAAPRYNEAEQAYEPAQVNDWEKDLMTGRYQLMEPSRELPVAEVKANWLWLVPGIAFDECGHRLGRGGGYYDRMLSKYPGKRIGVFYQCQCFQKTLPVEMHDCNLDMAVTQEKVYKF